ncbi:unnamed protein product [Schistocephalus solidus]|uniref:Leucine-rich repeat-containing protein 48 n=1 Tax=Schistocephalus solidus TaxID=70667 RepID=A0A183S738_SCHSO|nr:unnamed protein product [Schistocephalus solidus]
MLQVQLTSEGAQRIYGKLEPTVIDDELLTTACFAQGPTGEAGKLAEAEGIAFSSVKQLSLAYNNLSFNRISKIENLENLANLEDLSLFSNSISVIENLDKNTKLRFLSLGRNNINSLKNILYLRQFKHLDCLTIDNNPLCEEEGYENYIFAFLGKLKYLDYKYILPQWRAKAYDKYQIAVDQMNEAQLEYEEKVVEAQKEALFLEECKKAFIDEIIGDNLFNAMFAKDKDGQSLIKLSSVAELVEQYPYPGLHICLVFALLLHSSSSRNACKQLFLTGQEEYQKRKSEEDCLRSCIEDAKQDSKRRALESIAQYKETKKAIKKKLDDLYQDSFPEVAEALLSDLRQAIYELWNDLMGNEVSLVDQLEEIITDFGRNMSEMVSGFTESVQVCFSKVRESAGSFNERLAEMTLTYAERLAKTEAQQKPDPESSIYLDRDNLVNALNNSKEVHVSVIDKCEENVNKNLKQWLENLIEDLHQKEEYERHTNRVIEINMYIDDQRVDLETSELPQI